MDTMKTLEQKIEKKLYTKDEIRQMHSFVQKHIRYHQKQLRELEKQLYVTLPRPCKAGCGHQMMAKTTEGFGGKYTIHVCKICGCQED